MPVQTTTVGTYLRTDLYYSYDALRAYENAYVHGDNAGYLLSSSTPTVTIRAYDTFGQVYKGYTQLNDWGRNVFSSYLEDWTGNTAVASTYRVDPVRIQFSVLLFENQSASVIQWNSLRYESTGTGLAPLAFSPGTAFVSDTPQKFIDAHTGGYLSTVTGWLNGKSANPVYEIADASGTSVMTTAQAETLSAILPTISIKSGTTAVVTDNVTNVVSFINGAASDKILDAGIKIALSTGASPITTADAAVILGEGDSLAAGQVINVTDTPQAIGLHLDALKAGVSKIGSINVNGEIPLTHSDYLNSEPLFAKLNGTYSFKVRNATVSNVETLNGDVTVSSIEIVDTTGAVESNLIGLRTAQGKVSAITLTDASETQMELLVTQVTDNVALLETIVDHSLIKVRGTSNEVASNIDQLGRVASQVHSIELADSATPLELNASQTISHLPLIEKISNAYSIAITDLSENIAANLTALNAQLEKISSLNLSDIDSAPLVIEYAQRDAFINLSGKIAWPEGDGWENRIVRVDGVTLAQAQEIADLSVEGRFKVKLGIVDTAANLEGGSNLLQNLSVDQDAIAEITLLDTVATIDCSVYRAVGNISGGRVKVVNVEANNAQALLSDPDVQEIAFRDTAANLSSILPSLVGQESKITSIELSDAGNISITVPDNTSAITTLYNLRSLTSKFAEVYGIHLEGVSPYDLDQVLRNNSDVVSIGVQGRSYTLGPMLTQLHNWGSRVETIEITDAGSIVDIGATQLREQASTLDKISGSFTYRVSADYLDFDSTLWAKLDAMGDQVSSIKPFGSDFLRISRSDFATYEQTLAKVDNGARFYVQGLSAQEALDNAIDPMVLGVQISDTAANLSARADDLQSLASSRSGFYPILITQTDAGIPLELSLAQASLYERLFSRVETPFTIRVVDTSANISARLGGLYDQRDLISEVIVSDGAASPVAVAASEFIDYGSQLSKLTGDFSLKLTHATASQVSSLSNDSRFSSFEVWDNVTNISANLDRLLALGDRLGAVRYTHSIFSPLEIEADKVELYRPVLDKFVDGYYLDVEKVKAGAVAALLSQSGINRITVEDTASNFVTHLDTLAANAGRIDYVGIVGSSVMEMSATKAIQHYYVLNYWVVQNGPPGMQLNIVDATMDQTSRIRSYLPSAKIQISDTSSNIVNNLSSLSWAGDAVSQVNITDNVSTLSMSASSAVIFKDNSDKFAGDIKVRISDLAYNVKQVFTRLIELGSKLESIDLIGYPNSLSLSLSIDQFANASGLLSKISGGYTVALSGTQAQLSQQMDRLSLQADKISSIQIVDENKFWSGRVSEARRYADLLTKINIEGINLVDSASQLSYLDFSALASRNVTLTPTVLDSDVAINANDSLASIDFTRLVGSTFVATAINNGYGASIKVTQNGVTRTFTVVNEVFNDLVIKGYREDSRAQDVVVEGSSSQEVSTVNSSQADSNSTVFAVPIENIDAIGISPDGRYLIIKASGATRMVSYDSTLEFPNAKLSGTEMTSQITPTPVFSSVVNGSTQYVLPDLFTGPASLGLKYQLIDTTPNAVVTGSSDNDFIKVADANSLGKAVNGGGGNDVIDGGVGSTFISGGGGSNIFFLDGRASGVSWSTITDFQLGQDKVTIWGWRKGVSKVAMVDNSGGAPGYDGLTLHFENLLPSDAGAGATNERWNSITLSGRTLSDLGANSVEELNAQILAGTNPYLMTNQTVDDFGTHGYLHIA